MGYITGEKQIKALGGIQMTNNLKSSVYYI